ncbi:MFS transporter [Bacillus sp. CECT 9360]|uniref:MFS transporter n=1 Tax=Bacillus sp. CECT 9360 TaxID=2845821 RepID=UPI001E331E27|nr:MFS transporter [Bacillus sp. CECT 9360]CAH0345356.1 L-lactate transporter [Bacillus sp. CECT 9360]
MKKVHYSWIILVVTFFSIIVAGIIRSSSGVFLVPFEEEFGWDRAFISLSFAISLVIYGFSGPFVAALLENVGVKKIMVLAMSVLMVGIGLTFFMEYSWQLILIWGFIFGIGSSVFLTVLSTYVANHWFEKRRGLVLGILTASTATGQLILLPVLASIVERFSWKWAMGLIFFLSAVMIPLIFIFMKNSPKEVGLARYGQKEEAPIEPVLEKKNPVRLAFGILKEAVSVKTFWLLAGSFFICGLSTSGLIGTHFISYCAGFGIPAVTAAGLIAFMGIFDLIGTTLSGWLSDRYDNRWLLFWYYALRGLSLLLLPFALSENSMFFLVVFAVFYGLDWIATVPPTIGLATQTFGVEKSGIVYGWIFAAHQAGAGVAAYGGGLIFSIFNTYQWAFLMAGVFCFLGSLFVIGIRKSAEVSVDSKIEVVK